MPTPRRRLTRAEAQARTRDQLLAAAREVFAHHGYDGASVDAIAAHAGFSKGAVYSNFAGKESIFLALLEIHTRDELAWFAEQLAASARIDDALERLRTAWAAREADVDWGLLCLEFRLRAGRDPRFAAQVEELHAGQRRAFGGLISQLFARAGVRPPADPEELAMACMGVVQGLSLERATATTPLRPDLAGDSVVLILRGLIAVGTPA